MTRIGPPQHGQAGISAFVSRRFSPFLVRRSNMALSSHFLTFRAFEERGRCQALKPVPAVRDVNKMAAEA
jgi:hypothetical protein